LRDPDSAAREEILRKLAQSRDAVRSVLDPPRDRTDASGPMSVASGFPRSRTMKMLMNSRGLATLGALAGGLLIARPSLALRLLRLVPAGAIAEMLIARALSALKAKSAAGPR